MKLPHMTVNQSMQITNSVNAAAAKELETVFHSPQS